MKKYNSNVELLKGDLLSNNIIYRVEEIEKVGQIIAKDFFMDYYSFFIEDDWIRYTLSSEESFAFQSFLFDKMASRTIIENEDCFITISDLFNIIPNFVFDEIIVNENEVVYYNDSVIIKTFSLNEITSMMLNEKEKNRVLHRSIA